MSPSVKMHVVTKQTWSRCRTDQVHGSDPPLDLHLLLMKGCRPQGLVFSKMPSVQQSTRPHEWNSSCFARFSITRGASRPIWHSGCDKNVWNDRMTVIAAILIEKAQRAETVWTNSRRPARCVMWMRACAICKRLLTKHSLSDSVRCECGWEW